MNRLWLCIADEETLSPKNNWQDPIDYPLILAMKKNAFPLLIVLLFVAAAAVFAGYRSWVSFSPLTPPIRHAVGGQAYLRRYVSVASPYGTFCLAPGTLVHLTGQSESRFWRASDGRHEFAVPVREITDDIELGEMLRSRNENTPRSLAEVRRREQADGLADVVAGQAALRQRIGESRAAVAPAPPSIPSHEPAADARTSSELAAAHLAR